MIYTYQDLWNIKEIEIDYKLSKELEVEFIYRFKKDIFVKLYEADYISTLIFIDKSGAVERYIYGVDYTDINDIYWVDRFEFDIASDDETEIKKYLLLK